MSKFDSLLNILEIDSPKIKPRKFNNKKLKILKKGREKLKNIRIGTKIEMEHTTSKKRARKIAIDHIEEFPNYYTKGLIPMEKKLKRRIKK
jgi:hypothetical protein